VPPVPRARSPSVCGGDDPPGAPRRALRGDARGSGGERSSGPPVLSAGPRPPARRTRRVRRRNAPAHRGGSRPAPRACGRSRRPGSPGRCRRPATAVAGPRCGRR